MYKFHEKMNVNIVIFGGSWRFYQWDCKLGMGALWYGKSPEKCLKLSNSGNILKLLVPNDNQKIICGWEITYSLNINKFNNSCKVISQMMIESKIDYRGSKSIIVVVTHSFFVSLQSIVVKEQRVYGSWRKKVQYNSSPKLFLFQFFLIKKR